MTKKVLAVLLALMFILSSFPATVFAFEGEGNPYEDMSVTSIRIEPTQNMIKDKYYSIAEAENEYFNIQDVFNATKPSVTCYYNGGEAEYTYTYEEIFSGETNITIYFGSMTEDGEFVYEYASQMANPFVIGENKIYAEVEIGDNGFGREYTFVMEENPVESISVTATKNLIYNISGSNCEIYDENNENVIGEYFAYNIDQTEPTLTVTYKSGETVSYGYGDIYNETGTDIYFYPENSYDSYIDWQKDNRITECGSYKAKVVFMGHEATLDFNVVSDPVENVSVIFEEPIIENQKGYYDEYFDFYCYDESQFNPLITITYNDGRRPFSIYYEDAANNGINCALDFCQASVGALNVGKNTGRVFIENQWYEFEFEIVEDPIKSVTLTATKPIKEYVNGHPNAYKDENGEVIFEYYYDVFYDTEPTLTITYKDGTVKTIKYDEFIENYSGSVDFDSKEGKYGEITTIANIGSHNGEEYYENVPFKFTFVKNENTVKDIKVTANQNFYEGIDATLCLDYNEETDEYDIPVYDYALNLLTFDATITYENGKTETVKDLAFYDVIGDSNFCVGNFSNETRLNVGKNKVSVIYMNKLGYVDIVVEKNPYKSLTVSEDGALKFELIKNDGTKEICTVESMREFGAGSDGERQYRTEVVKTDKRTFLATVAFDARSNYFELPKNVEIVLGDTGFDEGIKVPSTNVLKECKSLRIYEQTVYALSYFADHKIAEEKAGREFNKFTVVTQENLDEMLSVGIGFAGYEIAGAGGTDENGAYYIVEADVLKEAASYVFDMSNADIKKSANYDAESDTYKLYEPKSYYGYTSLDSLEYKDGEYIVNTTYFNEELGLEFPVVAKLDNDLKYKSISFTAGKPAKVTGLSVKNESDGVKISWDYAENSSSYEIYRSENGGKYESVGASVTLSFTDTSVKSGKTYTYKVRGVNADLAGDYSATKTIDYLAEPSFKVSRANTGYTIKWNAVDGATGYRVYVAAKNDNGEWGSYRKIEDVKASVTSLSYKNVENGGTYKFTVRAINGKLLSTYTSSKEYIYLATPKVKIDNDADAIRGSWSKVSGAEEYILYRSEYSNGKWTSWVKLGTTKKTSFTDNTVESGVKYKYTVKAKNGSSESKYTSSNSVLFLAEPSVKISNAENGIKVKWSKVSGVTGYVVYSRQKVNGKWSGWSKRTTVKSNVFSWTDKKVKSGVEYKYTVKAVNGEESSTYSSSSGLIFLSQPAVKAKTDASSIKLTWGKISGAKSYTVYRKAVGVDKSWDNIGSAKSTSFTDKTVKSGVSYTYTVRAISGSSKSAYEGTKSVLFLAQPTAKTSNTEKGVKVSWNLVDGATGYTIYSREYKNGKWTSWKNRGTVKATVKSWTDEKVASGKQYSYTVRAVSGKVKSTYDATSGRYFLAQPVVKTANNASGVKVSWKKISGAKTYTVYRAEEIDGIFTSWKNIGNTKSTSYIDKTAVSGVNYKYTVRAVNGKSKSDYEGSKALMFLAQPKVTATVTEAGATVNWNAVNGATGYTIYRSEYNTKTKKWSSWKTVKKESAEAVAYTDSSIKDNVSYSYTVRATSETAKSTYKASNTIKK